MSKTPVRHPIIWSTGALIACLCFGCLAPKPAAPRPEAAFRQVPIGIGEDYPKAARNLATARRDLEVVKTNGLHVLRISFPWDAIEPEPGRYDWSFWDRFVDLATREYGLRLLPYVCYTPRWAASVQSDDFWRQPPADNACFASFLRRIVERYKDRIHSWEIWNEPDNAEYWRGSVEQFQGLLRAGSAAVRETAPEAKVVMGGLAWNLDFLQAMLTNAAVAQNVDVINLHNYYETWSSDPLEKLPDYVGRAHDILRTYGGGQPIWMAEVGYSSFRRGPYVSGQSRAFYQYEHTPEHQASSLFRAMSLLLASGKVSLVTWYRINDLPGTQEVIGDVNNRHLGVLDEHGRPKPGLRALAFFHSLFANGYRSIDRQVLGVRALRSDAEVHAFELPDGRIVVTAWLRTVVPGERGEDTRGQRVDQRREPLELVFPFPAGPAAERFDALGRRQGRVPVQTRDAESRVKLELRDGQVAVLAFQRPERRNFPSGSFGTKKRVLAQLYLRRAND